MPEETEAPAPDTLDEEGQNPHELTTRGVFYAKSASFAVLPAPMVEAVIANGKVSASKADGLWLFEQTSRIGTDNFVMKIRPRSEKYFATFTPFARPDEFTNLRRAFRDLGNVVPHASDFRRLARISFPCLLYVWTDGTSIYLRQAFTEEVWERMRLNVIATQDYIVANKDLFGLPFPTP